MPRGEVARAAANYLATEIRDRVIHLPVSFKLLLQIAEPGDDLYDPSIAWPDLRKLVELGTVEINSAMTDNAASEHQLLFLPGALPSGIEPEDPMIKARSDAYPVSYHRRSRTE